MVRKLKFTRQNPGRLVFVDGLETKLYHFDVCDIFGVDLREGQSKEIEIEIREPDTKVEVQDDEVYGFTTQDISWTSKKEALNSMEKFSKSDTQIRYLLKKLGSMKAETIIHKEGECK